MARKCIAAVFCSPRGNSRTSFTKQSPSTSYDPTATAGLPAPELKERLLAPSAISTPRSETGPESTAVLTSTVLPDAFNLYVPARLDTEHPFMVRSREIGRASCRER